ncbi:GNAT family N-acetyltransferase [Erwinia sp. 9145]|uniref:GNAT family N-acetyltransferase n=1 Tax=Erwinia sp. 9145 TaxID=1500895 RepID=UPI000907AEE9|nr:GNAT family N-acetyltransferase [Erwinia sp. 9145]
MNINTMQEKHLAAAFQLTQQVGWPHRLEDWQQMLKLGKGVVAESEGHLLGTTMFWPWGERYASIGLVIVSAHMQGKGLGSQLMRAALARLPEVNVRLHATAEGKALYLKYGFMPDGRVEQYQGVLTHPLSPSFASPGQTLRRAGPQDHTALTKLDCQAHGQYRPELIRWLLDSQINVLEEQGKISGFAALRHFGRGCYIGPVICGDLAAAKRLIASLVAERCGEFVRVDACAGTGLADWLTSSGLTQKDETLAMIRGEPWTPDGVRPFALVSQAMG